MLKRNLDRILFSLICLFPFLCLLVVDTFFFPYVTPKNFAFRALTEVLVALWIFLISLDAQYRPQKSILTWTYLVFIIVISVADYFGENPFKSFWSNFSRMEGLVTHLHLFAFYLVLTSVLNTKVRWSTFFKITFLISIGVGIYSFFQSVGLAAAVSMIRVDGTFGNPSYLAIYMALHFIIGLILLAEQNTKKLGFFYSLGCVITAVSLFLTQTRSALVGLVGGILFIVCALFFSPTARKFKRKIYFHLTAIIMATALIISGIKYFDLLPKVSDRIGNSSLADQSLQNRIYIWKLAGDSFKDHPWLGLGQENFIYSLKHYQPQMWGEAWTDRAHNNILEWLTSAGIFGCLAYLAFFVTTLYLLWFQNKNKIDLEIKIFISGFFICYFLNSLFLFDNITTYLVFFSVLAFVHFLSTSVKPTYSNQPIDWNIWHAVLGFFLCIFLVSGLYFANYKNIESNKILIQSSIASRAVLANANGSDRLLVESILDQNLLARAEIREQLIATANYIANQPLSYEFKQKVFLLTKKELEIELTRDPKNIYLKMIGGKFYGTYGQFGEADKLFVDALAISPRNQTILAEQGTFFIKTGQFVKVAETFRKIYELEPKFELARMYLALGLIYGNQSAEAHLIINQLYAIKSQEAHNSQFLAAWLNRKDFVSAAQFVNLKEQSGLADPEDLILLGNYFMMNNQNALAIDAFTKADRLGYRDKALIRALIKNAQAAKKI
ncbi:MAG: O-antigen ligase family protein [Bdellovibrio sp.]|nr:O-antigen ligase family protein [Bdellovibrio sp.]